MDAALSRTMSTNLAYMASLAPLRAKPSNESEYISPIACSMLIPMISVSKQ